MRTRTVYHLVVLFLIVNPWYTLALSLGDITLNSHAGEPLDARIEAALESHEDPQLASAALAPKGTYYLEDLQAPVFLDDVTVTFNPGPPAHIQLTTNLPPSTPRFSLIVRFRHQQETIQRLYTIALAAPDKDNTNVTETDIPIPEQQAAAPIEEFRAQTPPQPEPTAAPVQTKTARKPVPQVKDDAAARGGRYRVQSGDTLFRIAARLGVPQNNRPQAAVWIWNHNVKNGCCFIRDNLHGLTAGSRLTIPDDLQQQAITIEVNTARHIVREQWRLWNDPEAPSATTTAQAVPEPEPATVKVEIPDEIVPANDDHPQETPQSLTLVLPAASPGENPQPVALLDVVNMLEERLITRLQPFEANNSQQVPADYEMLINERFAQMEQRLMDRLDNLMRTTTPEDITINPEAPPVSPEISAFNNAANWITQQARQTNALVSDRTRTIAAGIAALLLLLLLTIIRIRRRRQKA